MSSWRYLHVLWVVGFSCTFELELEDRSLPPAVAFEYTNSGADELSGTVMIPVILSRPAEAEVSVSYSLASGAPGGKTTSKVASVGVS